MDHSVDHFPLPGAAPALKTGGSLTPPSPLSCGATPRRAGGGHAKPEPHGALPQRRRAIRANPRPIRIPGNNLDHNGEDFAL